MLCNVINETVGTICKWFYTITTAELCSQGVQGEYS